jgi:hypothetical protein
MMWMLFIMDGIKQERKWLVIEWKALKCANANSALFKKIASMNFHVKGDDCDITFMIMMVVK